MEIFATYGSGLFAPVQDPQVSGHEVRAKAENQIKQDPIQVDSTYADQRLNERSLLTPIRDRGAIFDAFF
jgi:hypothetical protein